MVFPVLYACFFVTSSAIILPLSFLLPPSSKNILDSFHCSWRAVFSERHRKGNRKRVAGKKVKPPFIQNKPIKTRLVSSAGCALSGGEKNGFDLCSTPVTRMPSYLQAKRGYQAQKERRVWFRKRQAGPLCWAFRERLCTCVYLAAAGPSGLWRGRTTSVEQRVSYIIFLSIPCLSAVERWDLVWYKTKQLQTQRCL